MNRADHHGRPLPLLEAVEAWAARTPEATAVSAPDGALTFRGLSERVRVLAAALRDGGAGPGTAVGVSYGRSYRQVVGVLAVLRAGATLVPLDDRNPAERLAYILKDADVRMLLGGLPAGASVPRLRRVTDPETGPDTALSAPSQTADPDDTAYVVYTSGTTGWPKGVEVTYGNLDAFLGALAELALPPGGTGINAVSPAFDGWLWCTLLYLLHGQGTTLIDLHHDGAGDLAEQITAARPRTVCLTPSLLATCTEALDGVQTLVLAGEPCPPGLVRRLPDGPRVLNVYGPTETTIAATWADSARGDDVTTIGRPLPGYHVHVLAEDGSPTPPGQVGELYIGGPGVARGYRNRPDLTAQSFVDDPCAGPGARMYRTGDLVSRLADGQLRHEGRADEQIKVRGFRVELPEVERTAGELPGVRACAAFRTATGDNLGLAVLGGPETAAPDWPARVIDHCAGRLPAPVVPAVVITLDTLPTTPSGKVDRAALARLAAEISARPGGRPPRTPRELQVRAAWEDVLGRSVPDADADFFALGGHSLLAARAVSELRRSTGLRISVRDLLASPTIAGLAATLDRIAAESGAGDEATAVND
ncbi:non-ribosomal peptide synthetase [Streptomyces sp. P10-4]|uniref:non-ribosomal peptide synthetase n=1 Tax=Streptomyces sp. P10-4 TaxID=3421645 RepID=UPI003D26F822